MKKTAVLALMLAFLASCASVTTQNVSMVRATDDEALMRKQAADETVAPREKPAAGRDKIKDGHYYTVRPGDVLSVIAVASAGGYSAWKKIAAANGLIQPYIIYPGEKLLITAAKPPAAPEVKAEKTFTYRVIPNKTFGAGEKLVFAVKYFGITAGTATLEVKDIEEINNRKVYRIEATARTAPF